MEVHFTPELEKKLNDIAAQAGRPTDNLVQDVVAGYVEELAEVRGMLDSRYDDLKSGRVKPIDGEAFFERLRQREAELTQRQPPCNRLRVRILPILLSFVVLAARPGAAAGR